MSRRQSISVLEAKIRAPLLSIKQPLAYQVAPSTLLPPPSTLLGALARGLAELEPHSQSCGEEFFADHLSLLSKVVDAAVVRPLPDARGICTYVILSRFRGLLEKKEMDEKKARDAMRREYFFISELAAYYVINAEELEKQGLTPEHLKRAANLIPRLGDTESLCSVVETHMLEGTVKDCREAMVNTMVKEDFVTEAEGDYIITPMTDENFRVSMRTPKMKKFYLPLKSAELRVGGRRFAIYEPSEFRVKVAEHARVVEIRSPTFVTPTVLVSGA